MALNLLFTIIVARYLSAAGAGVFFFAQILMMIVNLIGRGGMENLLLRHVAAYAAQGNWSALAKLSQMGIRLSVGLSAGLSGVIWMLAPWAATVFAEPDLTSTLRVIAVSAVPYNLAFLSSELLKGLKKYASAAFIQNTGIPLLGLLLLFSLKQVNDPVTVAVVYVLACTLIGLLAMLIWHRSLPRGLDAQEQPQVQLIAASLPFFWISLAILLLSSIDVLVLGYSAASSSVGIYSVAVRTAGLISVAATVVSSVVAPRFAALYAQGEHSALASLGRTATLIATVVSIPLVVLFVVWPRQVLGLFGHEFVGGVLPFIILVVGHLVNTVTGLVGNLLLMSGHEKVVRNCFFGAALLGGALSLVLIPALGMLGAALTSALTMTTVNLVLSIIVYRKLSIIMLPLPSRWLQRLMAKSASEHRQ